MSINAATHIGSVHLTVSDLARAILFYEMRLGLKLRHQENGTAVMGVAGGGELLVLSENRSAAARVRGTTGLYHFAILVPSRPDLAHRLRRLIETNTPMQGASDHGVSEALYLADPDGNGIEIYRDRPREAWPVVGGQLRMGVDPLDLDDLLKEETPGGSVEGDVIMPAGTTMGHVHLHVADLSAAHRFYVDVLGFDVMLRYGPSALFVSAGGYHHHIGLNTWAGVGAPAPPPDAVGLRYFEVRLPDRRALEDVTSRLGAADHRFDARDEGVFVQDPSLNGVLLTIAA